MRRQRSFIVSFVFRFTVVKEYNDLDELFADMKTWKNTSHREKYFLKEMRAVVNALWLFACLAPVKWVAVRFPRILYPCPCIDTFPRELRCGIDTLSKNTASSTPQRSLWSCCVVSKWRAHSAIFLQMLPILLTFPYNCVGCLYCRVDGLQHQ